jgi:O-antigen/teichoic acid export membrane protein
MSSSGENGPGPDPEAAGTRLKRLFANMSIYALGELGLTLLTAIFTPLLTFYLLPAELGTWSMSLMLYSGLSTICGLALHGAVTRYYYEHEFDASARRRFQGTISAFLLGWSLSLCVLLTFIGPQLFDVLFEDLPFWPYGGFVVWMAFLSVSSVVPKATWAAAERSRAFVAVSALGSATNLFASLGLVMFTSLGVLGLFWGRTASLAVVAIPFGLYWWRRVGFAWHLGDLKSALAFSLPLVPHLLAHWVLGMSDRFLIERYFGADGALSAAGTPAGLRAVGIYSAAYVFIEAVNMIAVSMNRAWVPQFTRAYGDEAEHGFVGRSITYFLAAIGAMSMALVVLSPTVVRAVFDAKYVAAAEIAPILALGGLFQGVYYIYVSGLFYYKRNRLVPLVTLVSGTVNVALNILWLPLFGLAGAAWATVIGYMLLALGMRWGCRRLTRLPFERGRLARLFGVLIGVGMAGTLVDGTFGLWTELLIKLGVLAAGVVVLRLSGFWAAEELAWMRLQLRKLPLIGRRGRR